MTYATLPPVTLGMTFAEASAAVLDHLRTVVPMGLWAVTRCDDGRQLFLEVRDDAFGLGPGASVPWEETFCVQMVTGRAPRVVPDAMAIPALAAAAGAAGLAIGSYVGVPIHDGDGTLFGTLCGIDPETRSSVLVGHEPLLQLLSTLLSAILAADLQRTEQERALERMLAEADTDQLTGLLNRRGWERRLAAEEERLARFGDRAVVLVIDLDGFKELNDREGHAAGDRHLVRAAGALRAATRASDLVARVGGDELAVLASVTPSEGEALAERVRAELAHAGVEASLGRADYDLGTGMCASVAAADAAMYDEKRRHQRRHPAR